MLIKALSDFLDKYARLTKLHLSAMRSGYAHRGIGEVRAAKVGN